uniref:CD248 molecule, endosialin a n=1 Tax=Fundulus heteroclitus TaxID=8078 RepID=A0A3Q2QI26_FUNHE
ACTHKLNQGRVRIISQDMRKGGAFCNAEGCFVIYFEDKIFLDSWRFCKEKGGNLATIKRKEEANAIATLFSTLELQDSHAKVRVWIGLQRQPRQCSSHPLRGFTWTTGDQDTEYTNWQSEDSPSTCLVPRCVAVGYNTQERSDNFLWIDHSCSVPVDGYLCHYAYKGMCSTLWSEHLGNDNGGCEHFCRQTGGQIFCDCTDGFDLRYDRLTCEPDVCQGNHCESECLPLSNGYRCACPDGYILATDEYSCLDVDECLESPCQQICKNLPGTFECQCWGGFILNEKEVCEDIDECLNDLCDHSCKNIPGSYICHCQQGFSVTHSCCYLIIAL